MVSAAHVKKVADLVKTPLSATFATLGTLLAPSCV